MLFGFCFSNDTVGVVLICSCHQLATFLIIISQNIKVGQVLRSNTLDGFTAQIGQIADEQYLKMSEDMADLADHWGVVGGKNIEKITSTIDQLSSQ